MLLTHPSSVVWFKILFDHFRRKILMQIPRGVEKELFGT